MLLSSKLLPQRVGKHVIGAWSWRQMKRAYDRQSRVDRLDVALGAAAVNGWTVIDMKKDWKVIFPFEKR
jgi:hypothetical protein